MRIRGELIWLALAPFLLFGLLFEVLPVVTLFFGSLSAEGGGVGLEAYQRAFSPTVVAAFGNSVRLALVTAGLGVVLGTFVAQAIVTSRSSRIRNALIALADVTTNFGGAPLAFAFILTLGSTGIITLLLKGVGISLYPGFRIYSVAGLMIAYLYFQLPLMILLVIPALRGLRTEWREAAENLGAPALKYWQHIGVPILAPSLLGGFLLLFANAFGAYATAWTLTGSDINLVTIQVAALISGEVQFDPAQADALAIMALAVMAGSVALYQVLAGRSRRPIQ
ncbi:MAG TPA: hypothetical protein VIM30_00760 [Candidatus Limnocylindrales bacterium]|jgi:putative spermidine/putrescine transport system permease protein